MGGDHKLIVSSGDQIIVVYRDVSVWTGESDSNLFGFPGWQAVRVELIRAALVADLQTGEIGVRSHHRVRPFHPAPVAYSDRNVGVAAGVEKKGHFYLV